LVPSPPATPFTVSRSPMKSKTRHKVQKETD
jgi:hypothetical protein